MNPLFAVPVSGLMTQTKRVAVSASNIANLGSTGVRGEPAASGDEGFVPHRVASVAGPQGGVRGQSVPISPASVEFYDPGAPDADEDGIVARPNVSLEGEMVTQMQAKRAYQANAEVIKTMDEMVGTLLDMDT